MQLRLKQTTSCLNAFFCKILGGFGYLQVVQAVYSWVPAESAADPGLTEELSEFGVGRAKW